MSWNKPSSSTKSEVSRNRRSHDRKHLLLISLLIAIIAFGTLILIWLSIANRHDALETARPTHRPKIQVVQRSKSPRLSDTNQVESAQMVIEREVGETWTENGALMKRIVFKGVTTNVPVTVRRKIPIKTQIFNYHSENVIAALLRMKPGESSFGEMNYDELEEDFKTSCREPIIVKEDDDDYTKQLKRDMIETKIDLCARMKAGESLQQILRETRDEYRKLSEYKRFIDSETTALIEKEDATAEDIETFQEAANKLLESRGIAPIDLGPIVRRRLLHREK